MKTYLFVYLGSALLALVTTPIVNLIARRMGLVGTPGPRHVHTQPIPHIGGVAIFISAMLPAIVVLFVSDISGRAFPDILPRLIVLLCAAGFIFLVGLVDDVRKNGLTARVKFMAQMAAAVWVCVAGMRIESVVVADWLMLDFGWWSWPLTLLWIVGITNAMNLCDGLDGLAAGISGVACGVIALLGFSSGNIAMMTLMLALLGSLTSFLFFNLNPAKIFMGDCGSMFLGFMVASSSILCATQPRSFIDFALPALALGVPILDTLFCILRRLVEGRSPFSADRRHFHHKLLELGLSQRQVVIAIHSLTVISAGLGMSMMVTTDGSSLLVFFLILLLLLAVFYVVGCVRPIEMLACVRRLRMTRTQKRQETRSFEDAQLYFRRAMTFEQWWQAVSTAAAKMDLSSLSMPLTNHDGASRVLTWRRHDQESEPHDNNLLKLNLPVRDRRSDRFLDLEVRAHRNDSLESAARKMVLFARLIEEHDLFDLPRSTRARRFAQGGVYDVTISDVVECENELASHRGDVAASSVQVADNSDGGHSSRSRMD